MSTEEHNPDGADSGSNDPERIGTEPIEGGGVYPYAGLTTYDEDVDAATLPENVWNQHSSMQFWAQNQVEHVFEDDVGIERDLDPSVLPERGLHTLIPELPRANHAQPAWIHPRTGDVMETAKHNAVINPQAAEDALGGYTSYEDAIASLFGYDQSDIAEVLEEMSFAEFEEEHLTPNQREQLEEVGIADDALYQIAGDDHTIINPQQPLEELVHEMQDRGWADKVFGEVRLDRGGGRGTLDLFIDGQHVESPVFAEDREPVVVGLEIQWSFYSDWAFRACGQGFDWRCDNRIHRMTDREVVKYAGDVEGRVDWREFMADLLDRLEEKRDQLARVIQSAANDHLDFADLPDDLGSRFEDEDAAPWVALYSYLGLPDYLARHAGKRLRSQAGDAYVPNWWEIHSAATYAVSHHDRGSRSAGGSYEDHARVANDLLMNPAEMEDRMVENYLAAQQPEEDSTIAEEGGGEAAIATAFENVREKRERYQEWEEELREMGVEL